MEHPVSAMVMLFARARKGQPRTGVLIDRVLRGAVLVDLALAGRLTDADCEISIDDTPTGYHPADDLAAAIGAQPGRTLLDWLVLREPVQEQLAGYWLVNGRWQLTRTGKQPRYRDLFEQQLEPSRAELRDVVDGDAEADPATSCIATLTQLGGMLGQEATRVDEELLALCGDAAWLLPMINDWATERIYRQNMAAGLASAGSGG